MLTDILLLVVATATHVNSPASKKSSVSIEYNRVYGFPSVGEVTTVVFAIMSDESRMVRFSVVKDTSRTIAVQLMEKLSDSNRLSPAELKLVIMTATCVDRKHKSTFYPFLLISVVHVHVNTLRKLTRSRGHSHTAGTGYSVFIAKCHDKK